MFYSHTFLARKGPLGTVWFAAHLQNKLKKSHYVSTDISSTVERIMFPEVPLALRMSGHLLLGIVRIYSKKVQFLHEDCNAALISLRKAFASIDLNLPEDARQAPVQAITLPDTFNLDAMDLDDEFNLDGAHDHHLRSQEDITLIDQVPIEVELYVSISLDEDIVDVPQANVTAMDQNVIDPTTVNDNEASTVRSNQIDEQNVANGDDNTLSNFIEDERPNDFFQDFGPSNPAEMHGSRHSNNSSPEVPTFETRRDAEHDSSGIPPMSPIGRNDFAEPQASLAQGMNEKGTVPQIIEDNLNIRGQTPPLHPSSGPQASVASLQEEPMINNASASLGSVSFAIRSTPPVQEQKARPRKRKQFYDEAPVLTNKFMKKALEDPSNLVRKRRNIPSSALGIWKLKNNLRKEQVFMEPTITGLCSDLCNVFNKDYISSKLQCLEELSASPVPATEPSPGHRGAEVQTPAYDNVDEIEHHMRVEDNDVGNIMPDFIPSPRVTPPRRDDVSPSLSENRASREVFPTPDLPGPARHEESELETPGSVFQDMQTEYENTGPLDVPGLDTADADDLLFLEADNNTPTGSQGTQGVDSLSVRTRAVAQFLKRLSPITPNSEAVSGDLSLNKLLQGKTRRLCARMFFETLVLKSNGLVDVQQEVPYGDITLKLTPELSKAQI
ncbi:Rad21/Rec8-like protein [Trema orientale]|uniref:Rad21/Rec8-like protein n=1 Tax=Trema orientale TaxID=63057 RepID=A0A2P5AY28_TREOI|nr:Rad21/Rec8-like protein [Trema orientale]